MEIKTSFIVRHWSCDEIKAVYSEKSAHRLSPMTVSDLCDTLEKKSIVDKSFEIGDWYEVIAPSVTSPSGYVTAGYSPSVCQKEGSNLGKWSDFEPDDFRGSPVKIK
jgi:hypothetical protein